VPVTVNQVVIRSGDVVTPASLEIVTLLGLTTARPDIQKFGGWVLLATLLVGLLLASVWRFRRDLWHRNNVMVLFGVLLVFAAFALKLTAERAALPFILPVAAVGMLVAILLDAGAATVVVAALAVIAGAVNGSSLEHMAYVFLGGFAGIVAIRRGDRLQAFLQAGLAVFVVQGLVVTTFSLLGTRDLRGILELWGASGLSAGGAAS
jgi:membrane-associated HD superfamily phosphohydrolase